MYDDEVASVANYPMNAKYLVVFHPSEAEQLSKTILKTRFVIIKNHVKWSLRNSWFKRLKDWLTYGSFKLKSLIWLNSKTDIFKMKLSSTNFLCLVSGVLLILVSSINAEYEWNGKEWIWKETPTVSIRSIRILAHHYQIYWFWNSWQWI